jgi:tetratricopeptide (TPR) repeat protein
MIRTQFKIHIQSSKMSNNYTRRLWLLCTAWMLCNVLQAQNLDRLEKLVDKARTPQERLDAMKTLIDSSSVVDLARTATYVERMRDMAQRAGSDYHLGFVEEKTGTLSYKGGVLDSARVQYKRAYDHYWRAGKREDALLVYTRIGIMYSIEGRFDDAERIYANTKARAGNLTKVYAYLYNQLGTLYTYKANADSAGYYYTQSVKQYKLLNDTVGYLRPMYNHAWMLSTNSKGKEAKTMAYTVLELQERMKAWEDASYTYGLLVNLLVGEGDYENALIYAEKNYNYVKIEKNSRKMMGALAALAQIKSASDNPAAGIPYLEEALAYAEESNEREAKEIALLELGQTYLDMGKFDRAKEYLTASLALTEDKRESYLAPTAMAHLGQAYYQTDQLKEAKHWLYQALDLLAQNQVTRDLPMVYGILASVHLTEKQPRLAIQMAEKAYSMAQEMGDNKTWFLEMTSTLYHAHKDVGDYQAALQYYEQHKQLSDTLYNVEKVKAEAKQLKDFEFKLEKETIAIEQQAREDKLKAKARQNAHDRGLHRPAGLGQYRLFCEPAQAAGTHPHPKRGTYAPQRHQRPHLRHHRPRYAQARPGIPRHDPKNQLPAPKRGLHPTDRSGQSIGRKRLLAEHRHRQPPQLGIAPKKYRRLPASNCSVATSGRGTPGHICHRRPQQKHPPQHLARRRAAAGIRRSAGLAHHPPQSH